jgi:hypothetical protein
MQDVSKKANESAPIINNKIVAAISAALTHHKKVSKVSHG